MSGTRKRTFESWISRRRINVGRWLKNHNITSMEALHTWCDNSSIQRPDSEAFQVYFTQPSVTSRPTKKKEPQTTKPKLEKSIPILERSEDPAVWHTPAAERPRKTRKRKYTKRKRAVKTDDS